MPGADEIEPPEEPELPPEIPEEKLRPFLEKFTDEARKLGLYVEAMAVNIDAHEPDDPAYHEPRHILVTQFIIGDHAFSATVQDPETDKMNHEFRKIESGSVNDAIEDIRKKYQKKDEPEE